MSMTEDNSFRKFKYKTRTTYRKHLWETIDYLDAVMNEVYLDKRFEGPVAKEGIFQDITMVIDGTDVPIDRPLHGHVERLKYFSGRQKDNTYSKYNFKYTSKSLILIFLIIILFL